MENEPSPGYWVLRARAWERFLEIREEYPRLDVDTAIREAVEQIFPPPYPTRMMEIGLSAINELVITAPENLPKPEDCSAVNILRFKLEESLEFYVRERWSAPERES